MTITIRIILNEQASLMNKNYETISLMNKNYETMNNNMNHDTMNNNMDELEQEQYQDQ